MPITLGLLIDTSGSEQNRLGAEQEAASRFLERVMKKGDEAMVISFDLDVDLLADFTDDRAQIERAINKARIGAVSGGVITPGTIPQGSNTGGTHFYDAVYLACNDKLATEAGRKALVIITDAQDEGSTAAAGRGDRIGAANGHGGACFAGARSGIFVAAGCGEEIERRNRRTDDRSVVRKETE